MKFKLEPVGFTAAASTLVHAVILGLQGFGVIHWTGDQVALAMGIWAAFVGMFLTTVVRNAVAPVAGPLVATPAVNQAGPDAP